MNGMLQEQHAVQQVFIASQLNLLRCHDSS